MQIHHEAPSAALLCPPMRQQRRQQEEGESLSIAERALQGFEGVTFARGHLDRLLLSLVALETPVGKFHQLRPKSGSPIDGGEIEVLEVPKKLELPLFLKVRPKKQLEVFAFFFWLASSRKDDRC